tara:strand:+ start:3600 stop:4352 length:753 start_codon:yes stop_codon:yes gene_type:complete
MRDTMNQGPVHFNLDICFDRYLSFKFNKEQSEQARQMLVAWDGVARFMAWHHDLKLIRPKDWHITIAHSSELKEQTEIKWKQNDFKLEYERNVMWKRLDDQHLTDFEDQMFDYKHYLKSFTSGYLAMDIRGKTSMGLFCEEITKTMINHIREGLNLDLMDWTPHITMANKTGDSSGSIGGIDITNDPTQFNNTTLKYFGAKWEGDFFDTSSVVSRMIMAKKKETNQINLDSYYHYWDSTNMGYTSEWGVE